MNKCKVNCEAGRGDIVKVKNNKDILKLSWKCVNTGHSVGFTMSHERFNNLSIKELISTISTILEWDETKNYDCLRLEAIKNIVKDYIIPKLDQTDNKLNKGE